jgi:hypothetical protein
MRASQVNLSLPRPIDVQGAAMVCGGAGASAERLRRLARSGV